MVELSCAFVSEIVGCMNDSFRAICRMVCWEGQAPAEPSSISNERTAGQEPRPLEAVHAQTAVLVDDSSYVV